MPVYDIFAFDSVIIPCQFFLKNDLNTFLPICLMKITHNFTIPDTCFIYISTRLQIYQLYILIIADFYG